MKKYIILIIAFLFSALCLNVFAQTKQYPFEVLKTGKGKQSIILFRDLRLLEMSLMKQEQHSKKISLVIRLQWPVSPA
ncbi:hypothetical protein [Flavobacterium daemonense]|uniref:hypothetical protein n=1 Tax=Flavobacterium daemonense TaxID=1393049 RepID=UPI001FEB9CF1|nr:hypothetical protein [Flavobacterium daemonense]